MDGVGRPLTHRVGQRGQAASDYLLTVALATSLVAIFVTMLWQPLLVLVARVVNHMAVFLSSVR